MDKALNFLGMCKKAGKLLTGEDGVSGAARNGEAALIMTAADTASNTTKKALNLSEWGRAPHVRLPWEAGLRDPGADGSGHGSGFRGKAGRPGPGLRADGGSPARRIIQKREEGT